MKKKRISNRRAWVYAAFIVSVVLLIATVVWLSQSTDFWQQWKEANQPLILQLK